MKKITLILSIILVLLIAYYFWNSYQKKHTFNTVPPVTIIDGKHLLATVTSTSDKSIDYSDPKILSGKSDYVVIAQVKTIDGAINLNPKTNQYIMTSTIGTISIEQVLKGDQSVSNNKSIKIIRAGGIISALEYEKGLKDTQIEKLGINDLSSAEKSSNYINEYYFDDISIQVGKRYLMYLKYDADFDRYSIIGFQYGLREYSGSTKKVKVNNTNKWEALTDKLY